MNSSRREPTPFFVGCTVRKAGEWVHDSRWYRSYDECIRFAQGNGIHLYEHKTELPFECFECFEILIVKEGQA